MAFKPLDVQVPVTDEKAPRRSGQQKPRAVPSTRSLKGEISGMLMTINIVIMMTPMRGDAMDMVELEALADALDEQARKSVRFRKALEAALAAQSGASLVGVLAIMAARRAARHGMIPGGPDMDQQLGNLLAQGAQVSKEARRASGIAA